MNRKTIIAGNWKMNASISFTQKMTNAILTELESINNQIIIFPPFLYLAQVNSLIKNTKLKLGAQNLNINTNGAFTGEVSANMINEFADFVIVGHSERRSLYGESNKIIANKIKTALAANLKPVFCIGEELDDRENGKTEQILQQQITAVIDVVDIKEFSNIIIAYEPIWAIGTGVTATPEQAQDTHNYIRNFLAKFDNDIAANIHILYGGSMNAGNAKQLLKCRDIDGGLIGGASLKVEDFLTICKAV